MKKLLVIINGKSGSGKDTFVNVCQKTLKKYDPTLPICNIHSSDEAKNVLYSFGWDGDRTPEVRKLLADMVQFVEDTGYNNTKLFRTIWAITKGVVFYHNRDPKSIATIVEHYKDCDDVCVKTLLIIRNQEFDNEEDRWNIENYDYDFLILNNFCTVEGFKLLGEDFAFELWDRFIEGN